MASARIPIAWLFLLAAVAVFAFFGYQIFQAAEGKEVEEKFPPYLPSREEAAVIERPAPAGAVAAPPAIHDAGADAGAEEAGPAPVVRNIPAHAMPRVPAQSEEDLRAPRQVMATPPAAHYGSPESLDPLNPSMHMGAEFGSNLRHPEHMMEAHPGIGIGSVVESGLGSEYSSPGGHRAAGYSPEMAQNGGEWMKGISAFDTSDIGVAYSML
jgi:hypothetical protein